MLHFRLLLAIVLTLATAEAAYAEIKITEAHYGAGILVVRGNVGAPGREVVLNGRVKKTSFRNGGFRFIVPGAAAGLHRPRRIRRRRGQRADRRLPAALRADGFSRVRRPTAHAPRAFQKRADRGRLFGRAGPTASAARRLFAATGRRRPVDLAAGHRHR